MFRHQRRDRRWIYDRAQGRVLDIGCADGWAREILSHCDYVGLDYPTTASGMYGTRPQVYADGASLPFLSESFDTVLLLEVLEHVLDAERVLTEISRVLKPKGRLLVSMPFLYPLHDAPHDYRRYTAPGLIQVLSSAGLQAEHVTPRNRGLKVAALLSAIACGEFMMDALNRRRWRLVFAPLVVAAIPLINILGWMFGWIGDGQMLASGHSAEARKSQ
ncbi:methyltransferase domain-containing protein [Dyella sp. RRB7]|uniref:class I SAM-dependent methyltransferase n=1 Tax=Dyella sp. RRB7 TaxID=2919502 RepID=UPI0031B8AB52